jgi:hypothetical protein
VFGAISCAAALAAFPFTVDDAFITGRYAARLAAGLGYTFNDGPPTDGVTGPAWLLPGVLAELAGLDAVIAAKLAGALCAALAVGLLVRAALRVSPFHAIAAGLFLVVQPNLAIWAGAGLETGAATLAVTIAALAATEEQPRGAAVGFAIGALGWLRPELALVGAVLVFATLRRQPRQGVIALALAGALALALVVFRLVLFGSAVPLSAYAKPGEIGHGALYAIGALLLVTGGGGLVLAGIAARFDERARVLGLAVAVAIVSVAIAGGDWMPGFRLLVPLLPLYALAAARGLALARDRSRLVKLAAYGCAAIALGLPALDFAIELPLAREAGALRDERAAILRDELSRYERVALVDIGYVAYGTDLETIDLAGVTDPEIARLPGGYLDKRIEEGFLSGRDPDAIVLHAIEEPLVTGGALDRYYTNQGVERRVAGMDFVRHEFRVARVLEYHSAYWYVVLARVETTGGARTYESE